MKVVEAIDAWIDDRIDDLSDPELEEILDLVDAIAASSFADRDVADIDDDDLDDIVGLVVGNDEQINFAQWVLSSSLFGDEDLGGSYLGATYLGTPYPITAEVPALGFDDPNAAAARGDGLVPEVEADDELDRFHREIMAVEVSRPSETATEPVAAVRLPVPKPLVMKPASDGLGPSFLPDIGAPSEAAAGRGAWVRWAAAGLIVAALAVFAFGMVRLVNSLDETPVAASGTEPTAAPADPTAPPAAGSTASPTSRPATVADGSASGQTAAGVEPVQAAIVLSDGRVVVAELGAPGAGTPARTEYVFAPDDAGDGGDSDGRRDEPDDATTPAARAEAGADDDGGDEAWAGAIGAIWLDDDIAVVDTDGEVLVIDRAAANRVEAIYEPDDTEPPAVAIVRVDARIAMLTADGNIWLLTRSPSGGTADRTLVWDAADQGDAATAISSVSDLLAFTLESGDAKLAVTSSPGNPIADLWSSEDQPAAFNVGGGPTGILLGVGDGRVARYRLGVDDGPPFESVWDPAETDEIPAIAYSAAGDRAAVILQDGTMVLADETGTGEKIWDPAETELRALAASASARDIIVLLETGSVVRIPIVGSPSLVDSIWDITDETLVPAVQVALKP